MERADASRGLGRLLAIIALCGLGVVALFMFVGDVRELIAERQYYVKAPWRLLIPLGVAVTVGGVLWVVTRLAPERRRRVILLGWGVGNVVGLCYAGFSFHMAVSFFLYGAIRNRSHGG